MKKTQISECGQAVVQLAERLRASKSKGTRDPQVQALLKEIDSLMSSDMPAASRVAALEKLSQQSMVRSAHEYGESFRLAAMLSSVKTQAISVVSGAFHGLIMPMERILGAKLSSLGGRVAKDPDAVRAMERVQRIARREALELANLKRTLQEYKMVLNLRGGAGKGNVWMGESPLDNPHISPFALKRVERILNDKNNSLMNGGLHLIEALTDAPTNMLQRGDSATKMLLGRARHTGIMEDHYLSKGHSPDEAIHMARDRAARIADRQVSVRQTLEEILAFKRAGKNISEENEVLLKELGIEDEADIAATVEGMQQGVDLGERATFTYDPVPGQERNVIEIVGGDLRSMVRRAPIFRVFLPFIKTPTNIASETWDRTAGVMMATADAAINKVFAKMGKERSGNWSKLMDDMNSSDPAKRAQALGKFSTSMMAMTGVTIMGATYDENGFPLITGSGPESTAEKASWKAAGWQERSIRVGDKYVSYDRLDPIAGAVLGFGAEIAQAVALADSEEDANMAQTVFMAAVASLATNVTGKTWSKGIKQAAELAENPSPETVRRIIRDYEGSFVPGIVRDVNKIVDPQLRDIDTITENLRSRIPGLSQRLDVRRNFMGEPIKFTESQGIHVWNTLAPFAIQDSKDDVIALEMLKVPGGISMPVTKMNGIDLKDELYDDKEGHSAYDRYLEISSEVKIGGRTMRQELRRLIKSPEYQRLDLQRTDDDENPRLGELKKVVSKYRKKAKTQLLRENKKLQRSIKDRKQSHNQRRRGLGFNF